MIHILDPCRRVGGVDYANMSTLVSRVLHQREGSFSDPLDDFLVSPPRRNPIADKHPHPYDLNFDIQQINNERESRGELHTNGFLVSVHKREHEDLHHEIKQP